MAEAKETSTDSIPLDELQHYRGVAQEQSMNTILSAQHRAENPNSSATATRDCIYDAIADAKKQIQEKDKIPFGGDVKEDGQDGKSVDNASSEKQESEESGSKGTLGDKLSSYAKNIKEAVVGTDDK